MLTPEDTGAGALGWRHISASVVGSGHLLRDLPCQDYHAVVVSDGRLLCAIADGAGSASMSQIGSETAVRAAMACLGANEGELNEAHFRTAFVAARGALESASEELSVPLGELACTLILFSADSWAVRVGQVGDGAIIASINGETLAVSAPQNGEYPNQTTFLTSDDFEKSLAFSDCRGAVKSVAGFTDGLEFVALKMPEAIPHEPFFASLFRFVEMTTDPALGHEQLEKFLLSDRLRERTDDDLTLVLACINPPEHIA